MLYDSKESAEPLYMHVKTDVILQTSETIRVTGVLAIRALMSPSNSANAVGVFETTSSSLIFFKSRQENASFLEVFAAPEHAGLGCTPF